MNLNKLSPERHESDNKHTSKTPNRMKKSFKDFVEKNIK